MRHFEKAGKRPLFRRFDVTGASLNLSIGQATEGLISTTIGHHSSAAARRAENAWVRWALDAGFGEVDLPEGEPGVVMYVHPASGDLRVRIDRRDDVYVPANSAANQTFRVGQRVIVHDLHERKGPEIEFMFGAVLEASSVSHFPAARTWRNQASPDVAESIRDRLAKSIGDALMGRFQYDPELKSLQCGSLIFAWERGIHRFIKFGSATDQPGIVRGPERLVFYESVLNSKLKRAASPILTCIPKFCAPVSGALMTMLGKHYGEGSLC